MTVPETRYAKSGDVRIAYQVIGNGPIDLVFVPGYVSNLDVHWEWPGFQHLMTRLASFTRLIMLDKRGTGLSDRVDNHHLPSLETRMDDVRAVMDAVGCGRAALLGASEGGPMATLFAATYPKRTRALILYGSYAHFHTWVMPREALEEFIRGIEESWGTGASAPRFAPNAAGDERFKSWWARYERLSASPGAAVALARMNSAIDTRSVLSSIRVPTLVLHRKHDARIKYGGGKYLAEKIKGAKFLTLSGHDHPIWTGDIDGVVDEIETFLTGVRPAPPPDRVLATIMVARGDRKKLETLRNEASESMARFGGHPEKSPDGGISARFDGPARAVRCALSLREAARAHGIELAAGVHTGEIELRDGAASGLAVAAAQHICAHAAPNEVLVSGVVTDLVAGSGLHFSERGAEQIEGFDHELRLFGAVDRPPVSPAAPQAAMHSLDALSPREREVLNLVAEGLSNAAIAKRIFLSEHTVKRHVANILVKLNLPTRAAAAALAGRQRA